MLDKLKKQLDRMERTYQVYKEDYARDGTITKEEAAILSNVAKKVAALREMVAELERQAGKPVVVKQVALGSLSWGGRGHGKLWGFTDKNGAVARGGADPLVKAMAAKNGLGDWALRAIGEAEALDGRWRSSHKAVREAAEKAKKDLKKLAKAVDAMRVRSNAKKNPARDGDFFNDVDGYLVAMEHAETIVGDIKKADRDFAKAATDLRTAVLEFERAEASKKVKLKEKELKQLEADIAEAKRILGTVMEVVIQVAKQDWEGLATRALSHLGEKSIDAGFAPDLKKLGAKLRVARSDLERLENAVLKGKIESARYGVESAAAGYERAEGKLATALEQLSRKQSNAENELKESSSTAIVGEMIVQRAKQLRAISTTRAACYLFARASEAAADRIGRISLEYAKVGVFLDIAAKADSDFDRAQPYAKMLEQSARANSSVLSLWGGFVEQDQDACHKALDWIEGSNDAMAPFDRAVEQVKSGLKNPS